MTLRGRIRLLVGGLVVLALAGGLAIAVLSPWPVGTAVGLGFLLLAVAELGARRLLARLEVLSHVAEQVVASGGLERPASLDERPDEIGRVGRAFNALLAKVEALLARQKRLMSDTSHELRNPLTVIRTNVDMLGRALDEDMRQEIVAETEGEIARMTRLVNDLVTLSSAETTPARKGEGVRLDRLAVETIDRIRAITHEHELEVEVQAHPVVEGDADRLRQIVTNLVGNAVRYTPGGGRIRVVVSYGDGKARISVEDTGVGIPAEHQAHVFDRFYRVDAARNRASGGAGLGLPIALALAEAHGGTIELRSEAGKGSCFTLVVPAELDTAAVTTRMPRLERMGGKAPDAP